MSKYEATTYSGEKVRGFIVYEGLNMFVVVRTPCGLERILCVPGSEREVDGEETN